MKVLTSVVTCPGVPTQIEGELEDGRVYYFRERHGFWSFGVGETQDTAVLHSFDSEWQGECEEFMSIEEARERIQALAASLRGSSQP